MRELTALERQALTDPTAMARATADGRSFRLEHRTISRLSIPALALDRAEFRDVEFVEVEIRGARFRDALLDHVRFKDCRLDGVAFNVCDLTRWRLEDAIVRESRFDGCVLRSWQTATCRFERVELERCRSESWEDDHGTFTASALIQVDLVTPKWKDTQLDAGRVERGSFADGRLEDVSFTSNQRRDLTFRRVEVDGLSVSFGGAEGLNFEEVRGRAVAVNDLTVNDLRFVASEIAGVTISGAVVNGLTIERCPVIAMLSVMKAKINGMRISDSRLPGLAILDSHVGQSELAHTALESPHLGSSTVEGLSARDTSMQGRVRVPGSRFQRLRLERVQYGSTYTLDAAGAVFEDGDRFPAKGP